MTNISFGSTYRIPVSQWGINNTKKLQLKNFISSIIFSNRYATPARSGSKWKFQAFLPKNASDFPPYRAHPPLSRALRKSRYPFVL